VGLCKQALPPVKNEQPAIRLTCTILKTMEKSQREP